VEKGTAQLAAIQEQLPFKRTKLSGHTRRESAAGLRG